ncbi:MAG: LLM class flavin-dependent oxidoreductase [bacterium]|nr:LLM class flavin-dependent oxidoreductase [bacterium]
MKFSVFSLLTWPRDRTRSGALHGELSRLAHAEEEGYDAVWLAEHGISQHGIGPAIHLAAANLAARTRTIRIGTAIAILPFMHPLRVAEEVAMLDILSAGRIDWGAGRGAGGVERDAIFHEQLQVIQKAWSGEAFSHAGARYNFDELSCYPEPVQPGGPAIHIATLEPAAVEWAARHGHPILEDPFSSFSGLAQQRDRYRAAGKANAVGHAAPTLRHVYVGETQAKAREEAAPALLASYRSLAQDAEAGDDSFFHLFGDDTLDRGADEEAIAAHLLDACAIVGDAAACRDRIAQLQETAGLSHLIAWQDFGGLDPQCSKASQQRLIEQVAPAFA